MNKDWYEQAVNDLWGDMNLNNYNKDWKEVRIFTFKTCHLSNRTLWPFTKAWTATQTNDAGVSFGGPPVTTRVWADPAELVWAILDGLEWPE